MPTRSYWSHGHAVTIEDGVHRAPDGRVNGHLVLNPRGWGGDVTTVGYAVTCWMHIAVPTVVESRVLGQYYLKRVVMLFTTVDAEVRDVHVYDGGTRLHSFESRALIGDHRGRTNRNTFEFPTRHRVRHGVGVSFLFSGRAFLGAGDRGPEPFLSLRSVGAEFESASVGTLLTEVLTSWRRGP